MQRMTISVSDFVREAVRDKLRDVKVIKVRMLLIMMRQREKYRIIIEHTMRRTHMKLPMC